MKKRQLYKGIAIMLSSSVTTCIGQLCWKLFSAQSSLIFLFLGFCMYGCGALLMVLALKYGELSVLHPMLSAGYILSFILGAVVLYERITLNKVIGVLVIILGLALISAPDKER